MPSAKKIEKTLQDALITLLDADTYIIANSLPVREWTDTDEELTARQIIVHANPAEPSLLKEDGDAAEWKVKLDVVSYVYTTTTETVGASTVYEYILGYLAALTRTTLATASGLTITGKQLVDSSESYDERFRGKVASIEVFAS